jgi:hypothetical protein
MRADYRANSLRSQAIRRLLFSRTSTQQLSFRRNELGENLRSTQEDSMIFDDEWRTLKKVQLQAEAFFQLQHNALHMESPGIGLSPLSEGFVSPLPEKKVPPASRLSIAATRSRPACDFRHVARRAHGSHIVINPVRFVHGKNQNAEVAGQLRDPRGGLEPAHFRHGDVQITTSGCSAWVASMA